jgi:hypothetical protein
MNFSGRTIPLWILRGGEWVFALFGAIVCIGVSIAVASYQFNDLWPLPGLYLIELILLALSGLISRVVDVGSVKMDTSLIAWMTGGVLMAFVILAGFSFGFYLLPAMLAFWLAATIADLRQKRPILRLAMALVAAVFQAALICVLLLVLSDIRS